MSTNLLELRQAHNLTQLQMAQLLGVSLRIYQYYEKGQREMPAYRWVNLKMLLNT